MSYLLRVLLVEDNPKEAELIVEQLPREESTQFEVECVPRLSEALARIVAERFDIILLDLGLPDSDGLDTLRTMRRQAARLPIVVLHEISDERVALAAIHEGAQNYLVKGQTDKSQLAREIKFAVERNHAEERERASEAKYRQLHESLMDAFCRVDMSGRFIECNGAYMNMLGYTEEEIRSLTYADITPVRWHPVEARIIDQQVLSRGYSDVYEKEYRRKDGTLLPIELRTILLKDETGRPSSMWGIIRDITERKQAEVALKRSEERYRHLLESVTDYVYSVQVENGQPVSSYHSPGCLTVAGYTPEEFAADLHLWYLMVHEEDRPAVLEQALRVLSGDASPLEHRIIHKDGGIRWVRNTPVLRRDQQDCIEAYDGIVTDITEQKRAEEERKKLEAQLQQAQKMEAIGTLAGGIAHDFNNSLTAIIGFGYLALMEMGPEDPQRQNIGHMLEGADRAAHLTKDLLIFSRKQVSEKRPVDLNEIIMHVEKFLVRVIGEDISCSISLHSEPIVVYADPHQLEQVLMNLATNARDAMAKVGDLIISAEQINVENDFVTIHGYGKPGRYALLTISDTGEGMDEETRQKIFDPFFTTKEVGEGTGLGLAVVYGIVKEHEGYINVYSEPGAGTTFRIYLPLISSEVPGEEIAPEKETLAKGTETILLAEDDESVRKLVSIVLKQEGYTVIEAVDGVDSVKKFMENRETIRLLLSDLIMPRMNGIEAYDEMKAWRPGLKAIFVSGYAPDVIRQKMSLENSVVLISKPILPYSLLKKVRNLLDEGEK
jgi:two-component system cell cycle sensor histidine kinase/response regulator CckA